MITDKNEILLNDVAEKVNEIIDVISCVNNKYNEIIINGFSNAEVIDARENLKGIIFDKLGNRLNNTDSQLLNLSDNFNTHLIEHPNNNTDLSNYVTKTELSLKQDITDSNLNTIDKKIVGAINEILLKSNNIALDIQSIINRLDSLENGEVLPPTDINVTSVLLDRTSLTMLKDNTEQLTANVYPTTATNKNVTWNSSDINISTVSNNGLITAINEGNSIISVITEDGNFSDSCNITVTLNNESNSGSIVLDNNSYSVSQGQDLIVNATMLNLPEYPVFELRQDNSYFQSAYKSNDSQITCYTSVVSEGYYSNMTIAAKNYNNDVGAYEDIAISNTFNLTIGDGGNGGDGETQPTNEYSTLKLMYPMPQSHGSIPNGAPSDWKYSSRWENQYKPSDWVAFCGWAQVYKVDGTSWTQNTGVEIKNYKVYGWKNSQWNLVTELSTPFGSFYAEDFFEDANNTFPSSRKYSSTGDSVIIKITSDMTVYTSQGNKNVCYHPFTPQVQYDSDFEYVYTSVEMRKIKFDEYGTDDVSYSRYCASCGGDWWREVGLSWAPDWTNNKGIAQPKIMEITTDWNTFSMSTVPEYWSNGFPN